MTEKTACPPSVQAKAAPAVQTFLSKAGREHYATALEMACAWFRSRDSMRQLQLHAAHQALLIHETALHKLQGAKQPADVLTIYSDLVSFYLEGLSQYWQEVATTAMQTQIELIARLNRTTTGKILVSRDDVFDRKPGDSTKQPFKHLTSVEARVG